jgi:hypothetical protein
MGRTRGYFTPVLSSRGFLCEGPDRIIRRFWWRRLDGGGDYDVSSVSFVSLCSSPFLIYLSLLSGGILFGDVEFFS